MPDLRALGFALVARALAISRSAPVPAALACPLACPQGALAVAGALTFTLWVFTGWPTGL